MDVQSSQIGKLIIEGKTKKVFELANGLTYILSKDRITAGDGIKSHEMVGKSILSTQTNAAVFEFLNAAGVKTAFVSRVSKSSPDHERAFIAKSCAMIPIEWVARRVATGSFLKRHPSVKEGFRFYPPKLETFFKDDANHDPFWSVETLVNSGLEANGVKVDKALVEEMFAVTSLVFELLERAWSTVDHSLIDMKIEFGVTSDRQVVVADVIDNDSWRLWPSGDKRLMLDKQVYRNMDASKIDAAAIQKVKENFEIVAKRTQDLFNGLVQKIVPTPQVGILMGSATDMDHCKKIESALHNLGVQNVSVHVCSAHKATKYALDVLASLQQWNTCKAIIAVAGRSNGLGPVAGANTTVPVLSCPPCDPSNVSLDIWSSIRLPSGMSAATILGPDNAALAAAHIVANEDAMIWAKIRAKQVYTYVKIIHEDAKINAH